MALSFKEKRAAQTSLAESLKALANAKLTFAEKRKEQKSVSLQLSILNGTNVQTGNSKLDDLIAGKYNDYAPEKFIATLEEIGKELQEDIEPLKQPVVNYVVHNQDKVSFVSE